MAALNYPPLFEELVDALKSLPGVGRRSAERLAFSILRWKPEKQARLGEIIKSLREKITDCPECGNLSSDGAPCGICASPARDKGVVCVVEEASQIFAFEKAASYKGVYHVLGGKLSPLEGKGASELKIDSLLKRVDNGGISEAILALSQDVEGQATSVYLAEILKKRGVKTTRLARGLPAGTDISYADSATIAAALSGRTQL